MLLRQKADELVARAGERRAWKMMANEYGVSFRGDENVPEPGSGDSCTIS